MKRGQSRIPQVPPRWDIAYSGEVVTPHVKWADPYARGPIRAFFVSSVHEGRTVVELMQRLTLEQRVVSIDPHWDVNKWCMDRYGAMDDLLPRDYSLAFRVLEEELAADITYDVLVMHGVRGWNEFPARVKELIRRRVSSGEGLVFVHPHLGEGKPDRSLWQISPIIGVPPTTLQEPGAGIDDGYPHPPKEAMSGEPWQRAADHYLVRGIPFEALPYPALQHYRYRLARDAQALVTGEGDGPVVAVKQYGEGRVVGLGYHNYGLFPELRARRGELNENFWEYLFGLLMRSIIWAAGKEPAVQITALATSVAEFGVGARASGRVRLGLHNTGAPTMAEVDVSFRDEQRQSEGRVAKKLRLARGRTEVALPLPRGVPNGGRHFVEVMVATGGRRQDWGTTTYQVARAARVAKVALDTPAVVVGGTLTGRATLAGNVEGLSLVSELWDQRRRLLARREARVGGRREVAFRLECPEALTNLGWVKCRLMAGKRLVDEARAEVALTAPRRRWEDYEVILPWLHGGLWPWSDLIEDQYRRAGITSTSDPQFNFPLTVSMHPPGFGVYWYRRQPYLERRAQYGKTRDTRYLARVPCFHSGDFRKPVAAALRKGIPPILKYSPLAYYLADESSVTCYEDALDLCWSKETLAEFRKWLRRHYRTLAALNSQWGTQHRSWQAVMPATWEEAQRRGNPAPWVDHRLFMNRTLADAFRYAVGVAKKVDPGGLVTISGTQLPGSHNGCDWWKVDQIIDYLQPYSVGGQDELHRSFNPKLILTGFTGYALSGLPLEYEIWRRFLHGHRGASIFWGYSFLDPDLTLNAQGRSFANTFGQLRGEGICRAVAGLTREHDKIALHYSMASGHVWWLHDGWLRYREGELEYGMSSSPSFQRFIRSRVAWGQVLEDIGYQYDYLSYEQIEKGDLRRRGFRVLVLPGSIALSEKEAQQIRAFVKAGGLVLADVRPGITDEHGKRRAAGALDDIFCADRFGRGRGVCPNRWLDDYPQVRFGGAGRAVRERVLRELERAKVAARVRVENEAGCYPVAVERVSWRGDGVEVLGLLKETRGSFTEMADGTMGFALREGMKEVDAVRVTLPRRGHWYDLRRHAYLGEIAELKASLKEADPKLYAMLPYHVEGLTLSVSARGRRDGLVRCAVRVRARAQRFAPHVVKLEVYGPDGEQRSVYSRNFSVRGGVGAIEFRLALNDAPGTWRVIATDVLSGARAGRRLRVV